MVDESVVCYSNPDVKELIRRTKLHGLNDGNDIKKVTLLIGKAYEKLIEIAFATTFIKYVLCSDKVLIIFTTENKEGKENRVSISDYGLNGVTHAPDEQFIIAFEKSKEKRDENYFSSLIIHEFAHFAFHEAFCNNYDPFFLKRKT